jgi:hypothetical protein
MGAVMRSVVRRLTQVLVLPLLTGLVARAVRRSRHRKADADLWAAATQAGGAPSPPAARAETSGTPKGT